MELMTVVFGVVGLVLAYALWIWWSDGKTCQPFCGRVCSRIRSVLGVVSRDEMRLLQEHFQHREQQWETRVTKLEATAKFSNQLQHVSKEIERRLTHLEQSQGQDPSSKISCALQPKSIVRFGVRLTLSEILWAHLGVESVDEIEDQLIDTMVQGPFCPVCLKWLVARDRTKKSAKVPVQCRHCGVSLNCQGTGMASVDLKRQVYGQLDQEYRTYGKIQPYAY